MERKDLKKYVSPVVEIVAEETESVICASFDDSMGGWVLDSREGFTVTEFENV